MYGQIDKESGSVRKKERKWDKPDPLTWTDRMDSMVYARVSAPSKQFWIRKKRL